MKRLRRAQGGESREQGLRGGVRRTTFALLEKLESRVLLSGETGSASVGGAERIPLGIHLELNRDWSRSFMFVDAMKSARQFGTPNAPWDEAAKVGPDGWPIEDFGAVIITMVPPASPVQDFPDISGTYHLTAKGKAVV